MHYSFNKILFLWCALGVEEQERGVFPGWRRRSWGYAKDARDIMGLGHEHAGYQLFLFPLIPCMGVRANLLRNK
jgi:hypothetical protein